MKDLKVREISQHGFEGSKLYLEGRGAGIGSRYPNSIGVTSGQDLLPGCQVESTKIVLRHFKLREIMYARVHSTMCTKSIDGL